MWRLYLRAWLSAWRGRSAGAALAVCAVFVALVAIHPFPPRLPRGVLQLTALDCGQGDALFLVLPDRTTVLLDAGGSRTRGAQEGGYQGRRWDSGEDIVSPYLWSRGIKKIDVVALTQARADHAGGLYAVLENFRVGEFWHAPQPETPEYAALLETVAERGIPTRTLMAGDTLQLGDASIHLLWPGRDSNNVAPGFSPASGHAGLKAGATSAASRDDDSLVMRITAGGINFLLPGDAGREAEKGPFDGHQADRQAGGIKLQHYRGQGAGRTRSGPPTPGWRSPSRRHPRSSPAGSKS